MFAIGDKHKRVEVLVDGLPIKFIIDSGSTVNIVDYNTFKLLKNTTKLFDTNLQVFTYGSKDPLKLVGVFYPTLAVGSTQTIQPILVATHESAGCIMSEKTSSALGFLEVKQFINTVGINEKPHDSTINRILNKYPSVLSGVGKLKDFQLQLNIDKTIEPVIERARQISFHQRNLVEEEMKQLLKDDIIEPGHLRYTQR